MTSKVPSKHRLQTNHKKSPAINHTHNHDISIGTNVFSQAALLFNLFLLPAYSRVLAFFSTPVIEQLRLDYLSLGESK